MTNRSERLSSCPPVFESEISQGRQQTQLTAANDVQMASDDTQGVLASVRMITGNGLHETNDCQQMYM